jgi:membrane protein YqaA with SNARE-associated domain
MLILVLQGAGLLAVLTAAWWLARLAHDSEAVKQAVAMYGYIGVFLVAFVSGLNLVVPIPATAFIPLFLEAGLVFSVSVMVMSAGMTVADGIAYAFGFLGRTAYATVQGNGKAIRRLEAIRRRHRHGPLLALLAFASFVPLPNEVMVIPLGVLGYRPTYILPIVFVGNIIFNTLYASGIVRLFQFV